MVHKTSRRRFLMIFWWFCRSSYPKQRQFDLMFTHFRYDDRLTLAAPSCANGTPDYISEFREGKIATITVPRLLQVADLKPDKSHDKKTQNITNIFRFTKIKQKV